MDLVETIKEIKKRNPLETKTVEYYVNHIMLSCKHVPEDLILQALRVYETKDLYDKPVVYLRAIILNLYREREKESLKQLASLGSIPIPKR